MCEVVQRLFLSPSLVAAGTRDSPVFVGARHARHAWTCKEAGSQLLERCAMGTT